MTFETGRNTKVRIVTLLVMDDGLLEVGTVERPIAATARAEIQIADQPIDMRLDPGQVGNGIVGLGRIRMHGAVKTPTFARLAGEARASQTTFVLDRSVQGWAMGDRIVFPDTRQLREAERGGAPSSPATSRSKSCPWMAPRSRCGRRSSGIIRAPTTAKA